MPHLERTCVDYIKDYSNPYNVCKLLPQCRLFEEPELIQHCWDIIDTQSEKMLKSVSFTDIDHQTLKEILSRETLHVTEKTVFAAAMRWAEAECTRQGQVQSPLQCREVLGDALYLLRFPTMTPDDFANGPGQSGLLNMQETNDLFFHVAIDNKPKLCFPTTSRKGRLRSCVRFKMTNKIWCNPGSRCDSICFSVDKSISVVGFGMYRCSSTKPVRVYIALQQGVYTLRQNAFICPNASKDTVARLFFDSPVRLQAHTYYTAYLDKTFQEHAQENTGIVGMSLVNSGGINFTFMNCPDSKRGTDVHRGQIPEILFCQIDDVTGWDLCGCNRKSFQEPKQEQCGAGLICVDVIENSSSSTMCLPLRYVEFSPISLTPTNPTAHCFSSGRIQTGCRPHGYFQFLSPLGLPYPHNTGIHPIAHPLGWDMGCLLWF